MNDEQGLIETLDDRCNTLEFLARVYMGELPAPALETILIEMSAPAPDGDPESPGRRALRAFAESVRNDPIESVATDLATEYVAMFFVSWKRTLSPFESVYRSSNHAMMQDASVEMQQLYASAGIQLSESFTEPPDHIAAEFAYMAHLCRGCLDAARSGKLDVAAHSLGEQALFLEKHLAPWAPEFCKDMARLTRSEFYRGIALLTEEFLEMEAGTIQELSISLASSPARA